jgi:hypothetical protein
MMTHRRATHSPISESSVAWYKIIAISFLFLTILLLILVLYMTTKRANITIVAKEEPVTVQMAVLVGRLSEGGEGVKVPGVVTSTSFVWSKKYYPGATETVEGTARGEVVVYNKTAQPIALKPTTRLLAENGVLFRLKSYTPVPANGQVAAEVYADQAGKDGDIAPSRFTIPGLSTDLQKDIYALSSKTMSGGGTMIGVVTAEDIDGALRDYKEKTGENFLNTVSSTYMQKGRKLLVSVLENKTDVDQKPGAKVREFFVSGTSTMVIVSYDPDELTRVVEKNIAQKIDVQNEKILSSDGAATVALNSTSLATGSAELSVSKKLIVTLSEDSSQALKKENYTDKTKEEIEQYIKTLPHAISGEVRFSPSWLMRSAPSIPDKIIVNVRVVK